MIHSFSNQIKNKNDEYVIFDLGSRDCLQSIEFYHEFPNSKIYAFECNPNTLSICKKNIEAFTDRITLIEGAVCDYDGFIKFYPINQEKTITTWSDGNPGASSLFQSNGCYTVEKYVQDEIVTNCHRLDSVMEKYNIPQVDILWMDLQGAELLALKGLGKYLNHVKYVYTEVSHKAIYNGQVMFSELNDFMLTNHFVAKNNLSMNGWQEDVFYERKDIYDLTSFQCNKYSQRGHDGIIEKIMKELNIEKGFFIEFGAWDGIHLSNCKNLHDNGWTGCFIEADKNKYTQLVENFKNSRHVLCLNHFVFPSKEEGDTLDMLHQQHMNHIEVDLLSVDIDGREYEILKHLEMKPKLIIIEGGFFFHPLFKNKIPCHEAMHNIQQPIYVMIELAKKKGYTPICFNQDTFLLRNDLFENHNYFQNLKTDFYSLWKSGYDNVFNDSEKTWLQNFRKTNNKYEHSYYLNLNHSLDNAFDVVIAVGPKDKGIIEKQLEYTKKNILGYRHIYLICDDSTLCFEGCITVDERIFPFTLDTVSKIHGKLERNGWYLQQLLKLYAGWVIPNILNKYLVIDCDTFFLNPTFFVQDNKCLYNYGDEHYPPYFEHMKKLCVDFEKMENAKSGICHHMMFETKYVKEIINIVEKNHHDEFYNVFLKTVTKKNISGASEYEIYFNYILKYHHDKIVLRKLNWKNTGNFDLTNNFDYISVHWCLRT